MKKLVLIFAFLAVPFVQAQEPAVSVTGTTKSAALGEQCGGDDKTACNSGVCIFDTNTKSASGICMDTVALGEELQHVGLWEKIRGFFLKLFNRPVFECGEEKDPVCGELKGQLHGFQNECQVKRHGATFVSKGFCTFDPKATGSCEARAMGMGTCFEQFEGYEFDGKACVKRYLAGCEAQIPFRTQAECEKMCQ